ncbi:hypothetical protein [Nocardia bovistercoris]|uniref:Uncharacterized protein n=1 Tax=Nocardia bovistercoris TaxID=2785916 RepID=A0A931IHK4_9NOCA|nr:hypothetical protein [Nocardia bovistercoris]MBH0780511.1 hypothetical protein [Nocardia bovistercoris]
MPTVDELFWRLTVALADHLTDGRNNSSEAELVYGAGEVIRLWVEDGSVRAEFDSPEGGPEIWVFAPGRDDIEEFIETVVDAV